MKWIDGGNGSCTVTKAIEQTADKRDVETISYQGTPMILSFLVMIEREAWKR
jgi:hypothetical protein